MTIRISPFYGELPKITPKMLPDAHAVKAENCDLESQSLRPAKGLLLDSTVAATAESIYRHPAGVWFSWDSPGVSAVKSPLNDDVWDRVYWTGESEPRYTTYALATSGATIPAASYVLGVPAPQTAPSLDDASGEPGAGGVVIDTAYVVTFGSEFGEEGPPSPASELVTRYDGGTVNLTNIPVPPGGNMSLTRKWLYRVETAGSFLLVAELPAAQTTYSDSVNTAELGGPLVSIDWDGPDSRMAGLTHLGNGMLAGHFENTLCFCEPYHPHAWPVGYQLGFVADIVGIVPVSGGLIVVTEAEPYLVSGATPAAMFQQKLDFNIGGVSRLSVVDMGEYAIFASDEGLVQIGGTRASVITEGMLSREQWQALNPQSIHAYRWHERYLAFYEDNGVWKRFLLHPEHGLIHGDGAPAGTYDTTRGEVYLLDGGAISAWDAGTDLAYSWQSKLFSLPGMPTLTCGRIDTEGSVGITIWADGIELVNETVDNQMFRLPAGRYRDWQVQLDGSAEVLSVQLVPYPGDLL